MLWLIYKRPERTLCTLGDAIPSFLEEPDPYTEHCGVATRATIEASGTENLTWNEGEDRAWQPATTGWYQAASQTRWLFTMITYVQIQQISSTDS